MSLYERAYISMMRDKNTGKDGVLESLETGAPAVIVRGLFYSADETSRMNQVSISVSKPEFHCLGSEVEGVEKGRKITIGATVFYIKEIRPPDETGLSILLLTTDN
jgi:hypothetical protein